MAGKQKQLFIIGILIVIIGIILGAFAAHGLEEKLSSEKLSTFEVGVRYQMYHGFGFLVLGLLFPYATFSMKWIKILMLLGVLFFSGSIYLLATQELIGLNVSKMLGPITPIGGLLLILSWTVLMIQLIRQK